MRQSRTTSALTGAALLAMTAAGPTAFAAPRDHHHHRHHSYDGEYHRGGFGRYDPDNIGIYGGRDFGFLDGPNGQTTYDYR